MTDKKEIDWSNPLQVIGPEELGPLLGRSVKTVRVDATRRPETLPPRWIVPGLRKLQWTVGAVKDWMAALALVEEQKRVAALRFNQANGIKGAPTRKPLNLQHSHDTVLAAGCELRAGQVVPSGA